MNIYAATHVQAALDCLDQTGQGHSVAACHLDAALNALGYTPKPVDETGVATLIFEELEPA